jgi:hypothetical protein
MSKLEKEKQKLLLYWKANCPSRIMKTTLTVAAAAAVVVAVAVAVVRAILLAIQVLEQD